MTAFTNSLRTERLSETIVDATKAHLRPDQRHQGLLLHGPGRRCRMSISAQSLMTTLVMFQSRLEGIEVVTDFAPDLPPISAYGSELSQVWTVLIENALDAMTGRGTLRPHHARSPAPSPRLKSGITVPASPTRFARASSSRSSRPSRQAAALGSASIPPPASSADTPDSSRSTPVPTRPASRSAFPSTAPTPTEFLREAICGPVSS